MKLEQGWNCDRQRFYPFVASVQLQQGAPRQTHKQHFKAGFTLIEMLVVIVLVGILAAIGAIGWRSFWHQRLLAAAQDEVFQTLRQAQAEARWTQSNWQASFQQLNGVVHWSIHPVTAPASDIHWQTLDSNIQITQTTTLARSNQIYRVEFDHQGNVSSLLGRLTLKVKDGGTAKRCVFVSTLLGAMRKTSNCD